MRLLFFLLFCAFSVSAIAQDTAYTALNTVGKVRGDAYLDNLLNLEGLSGDTQPGSWRLIFEDASSRAGYREIEVRGGEIISQRAPLKNPFGASDRVNLNRLQLDSDGAFTVAEREAVRQRIRFNSANYLLLNDPDTGNPAWRVQLLNSAGRVVLTTRISADTGRVLAIGGGPRRSQPDFEPEPRPSRRSVVVEDYDDAGYDEGISTEQKIHRGIVRTGRSIGNGFRRVGGSLQEIFTGRRTIDSDLRDE